MILQDCDLVQTIPGAAADWNVVHKRTVHILKPDNNGGIKGGMMGGSRHHEFPPVFPSCHGVYQSLMFGGSWIFWCKNQVKHNQTW